MLQVNSSSALNSSNNSSPSNTSAATDSQLYAAVNIVNVVILCILIPIIVVGNSLVCVVFLKYQRIRTPTNCFIFSLAISDLAVGLILVPFWIVLTVTRFDVPLPALIFNQILDIICSVASMTNLASVSIERWYGVTYPFLHMRISVKKASFMAASSWLYALIIGLLFPLQTSASFIIITVMGLVVPFLIMMVAYISIAVRIRKKSKSNPTYDGREWKTVRTILIITVVFLICYLPFIVGSMVSTHCQRCVIYIHQNPLLHNFPKILHYSNSCINPVLYALFSPSVRSGFKSLFGISRKNLARNLARQYRHERLSGDVTSTGVSMIRRSHFIDWNTINKHHSTYGGSNKSLPMQVAGNDGIHLTTMAPLLKHASCPSINKPLSINGNHKIHSITMLPSPQPTSGQPDHKPLLSKTNGEDDHETKQKSSSMSNIRRIMAESSRGSSSPKSTKKEVLIHGTPHVTHLPLIRVDQETFDTTESSHDKEINSNGLGADKINSQSRKNVEELIERELEKPDRESYV